MKTLCSVLVLLVLPARAAHAQARAVVAVWPTDAPSMPVVALVRAALERRSMEVRTLDDLGAAPARTEHPPQGARDALAEAVRRYGGAELDVALATLDRLEANLIDWVDGDVVALGQLLAWKAACLAKLRRTAEARAYFALAVRLGARPDASVLSPDVMALVPAPVSLATSGARLELHRRPEGASIEIDGRTVDESAPGIFDVGAGLHLVVVRAPGHTTGARIVAAPGRIEIAAAAVAAPELRGSLARLRDDARLHPGSVLATSSVASALGASRVVLLEATAGTEGTALVFLDSAGAELARAAADSRTSAAMDRAVARLLGERSSATPPIVRPRARRHPGRAPDASSTSVFERWWFWTAVGVLVAGTAVTTGAVVAGSEDTYRVVVATPR